MGGQESCCSSSKNYEDIVVQQDEASVWQAPRKEEGTNEEVITPSVSPRSTRQDSLDEPVSPAVTPRSSLRAKLSNSCWKQKATGQAVGTVRRGVIHFAKCFEQGDAPLTLEEDDVSMLVGSKKHTGKIKTDQDGNALQFVWSDGDIWIRDTLRELEDTRWKRKAGGHKMGVIQDGYMIWEKDLQAFGEEMSELAVQDAGLLEMFVPAAKNGKFTGTVKTKSGRITHICWSDGDVWVPDTILR
eukprot:TRINITY_DN107644_c0_g1_i1.p1 TRINITY_DN107644_c0_g1~~TRINITY_DN107644_c0_g1_i1.p1  ORF type:complete len:268 (-),score=40.52 TRINITY_DN107644_c0_g1_i1:87-815(-)